jgi:hypothetical protein
MIHEKNHVPAPSVHSFRASPGCGSFNRRNPADSSLQEGGPVRYSYGNVENALSRLKANEVISSRIINVYTDFFINELWGIEGIDYFFVPDATLKHVLLRKGVALDRIFVTGIPLHPKITEKKHKTMLPDTMTVNCYRRQQCHLFSCS